MTLLSPRAINRFLAAALTVAVPLAAAAQPGSAAGCDAGGHRNYGKHARMGHPGMMGPMSPHHLRGLDLTEVQQDKIFEIWHAQAPLARGQGKALREAERDLRMLSNSPDYSEAKAKSLADAAARATADMALTRAKIDHQIHDLLTPEQRKRLSERKFPNKPAPARRSPDTRS